MTKDNFAGGSPAASYFLLLRQKESHQRKGDPGLRRRTGERKSEGGLCARFCFVASVARYAGDGADTAKAKLDPTPRFAPL
jgi:hypothetical protein